jgi:hypothetical protein
MHAIPSLDAGGPATRPTSRMVFAAEPGRELVADLVPGRRDRLRAGLDMHDEWQPGVRHYLSETSMALLKPGAHIQAIAAIDSGE